MIPIAEVFASMVLFWIAFAIDTISQLSNSVAKLRVRLNELPVAEK
jgi:hypothetical protein